MRIISLQGIVCVSGAIPAGALVSAALLLCAALVSVRSVRAADPTVLVSSFMPAGEGGIQSFSLDMASGVLTAGPRSPAIPNPFFFDVSPDQQRLYSIHAETFGGASAEAVAAFEFTGDVSLLRPLNRETTRGTASCFVEVDRSGRCLLVANYSSGDVISYRIDSSGRLSAPVSFIQHAGRSVNTSRQSEPHAHCFVISPNNRFAYAADLGIDQIVCYRLNSETGELSTAEQAFVRLPPGSGPRHLTFHPKQPWMYVINELLNTVTAFDWNAETGMLIERSTLSTLPADFKKESWCANMPGNNVQVFRIDAESGNLEPAGGAVEIPMPSCIRILPGKP